jgi:hypothetical protein
MATRDIPNPFEKVPKHDVAVWLEHPATRVLMASLAGIAVWADGALLSAAAAAEVSPVAVARAHGRKVASEEALEIFAKAGRHVGQE